jgi:Fe-S cluster biosynthesis and repair protein YggX
MVRGESGSAGTRTRAALAAFLITTRRPRMPDVTCTRCGETRAGFERAPFPGAIGARIASEICQTCWGEWLRHQTMLINHYGLNVMDPQARQFLTRNMEAFFFKAGAEEDVDTSKKGTITW